MKLFMIILLASSLFAQEATIKEPQGERLSLLNKISNPYGEYLKTLIKEQKMNKAQIKEILNSNKMTIRSNILKGLHEQYYKKDISRASKYFDKIIQRAPNLIKDTSNAMFLADYLVIKEQFPLINKILSTNYCINLLSDNEGRCLYYVYLGKHFSKEDSLEELMLLNKKENAIYKKILLNEGLIK